MLPPKSPSVLPPKTLSGSSPVHSRSVIDWGSNLSRGRGRTRQWTLQALDSECIKTLVIALHAVYVLLGVATILVDLGLICIQPVLVHASGPPPPPAEFLAIRSRFPVTRYRYLQPDQASNSGIPEDLLECTAPYSKTLGLTLSIASLSLSSLLLSEYVVRIFCVSVGYYVQHRWLCIEFFCALVCVLADLVVLLLLRPRLVMAWKGGTETVGGGLSATEAAIVVLRLWRLVLAFRLIRAIRAQWQPGTEIARTIEITHVFHEEMPTAILHSVEVIRNTDSELRQFAERRRLMSELHGSVESKLLFFCGSPSMNPAHVLQSGGCLDNRFATDGMLGHAVYGAERPAYADSCYAFQNLDKDPDGTMRQLIVFEALLGEVQDLCYDASPQRREPDPGFDSVCGGPWVPPEYRPEDFDLECRDVSSSIYALYGYTGQALLVAVLTYDNPAVSDETMALGGQTWQDYALVRPPDLNDVQVKALNALEAGIDSRDPVAFEQSMHQCREARVPEEKVRQVKSAKKMESEGAGISLAYILSDEFEKMAREATGKDDPSFVDMKEPFFLSSSSTKRIGDGQLCPRDLRAGCAFVDTLPRKYRHDATHFLSWVWQYKLSTFRGGLQRWADANQLVYEDVFLFCCFFCNNQHRILVEGSSQGSDDLEFVFEARLRQIGRVVALMDTWQGSIYTRRIWTIFEQYMAARLGIEMQFTLPAEPAATLIDHLHKGAEGIQTVIKEVSQVDAKHAKATMQQDEDKVKHLIMSTIGFPTVNERVQCSITDWIAREFKARIDHLVEMEVRTTGASWLSFTRTFTRRPDEHDC